MPYLGNQPAAIGSYLHQTFAGDGSAVDFTLSRAASTNTIIVAIDCVDQIPTTAYSVITGTTLRFTAAPPNSTTISVRHLGDQVDFGAPSAASVSAAKLATTGTASSSVYLRGDMAWAAVPAGSPTGSSDEAVFFNNENQVDNSYTIPTNFNSISAGPVTIASGAVVTVPANSVWVIV